MATDTWSKGKGGPEDGWQASAAVLFGPEGAKPAYIVQTNDVSSFELSPEAGDTEHHDPAQYSTSDDAMSTQDRYIDSRLATIEDNLDRRMADFQRFQERAEDRFERTSAAAEERMRQDHAAAEQRMRDAVAEVKADSKSTRVTVLVTTVTSAIAVVGLVATIIIGQVSSFQSTVSEQGAWLRQSIDRIAGAEASIPSPSEKTESPTRSE